MRCSSTVTRPTTPIRGLVRDAHLYLDNRLSAAMLATAPEMTARAERLRSGAPLRLIHSGPVGADERRARPAAGDGCAGHARVDATLDIYGTGSLEGDIRAGWTVSAGACGAARSGRFRARIGAINRSRADVFLSCHRQSDPSCTLSGSNGLRGLAVPGSTMPCGAGSRPAAAAARWRSWAMSPRLADVVARWHHDRETP